MKLRVKANYRSRDLGYSKDSIIEVDAEFGRFLMVDAPGCFEEVGKGDPKPESKPEVDNPDLDPEAKAIDAPPKNTMVSKPKAKK